MRALADLHRHLDGSLRPTTLAELAERHGQRVPEALAFFPGMGLSAALERFAFTLSLLQEPETVRRVAFELCEDAAAEGVTTLELRFAPQLHRGAPVDDVVDAALEGLAGKAGLILCGLYGEAPEVLESLVEVAARRPGVVGIDLAGGPSRSHRFGLADYARAFSRARDVGLGRTVHAAEGRAAEEICLAIELLHAQRIGHGTTLLESKRAVELVRSKGVVLEACLTSNLHTGAVERLEAHPLVQWLERGVRACVCADNTLLSGTSAAQEHALAARLPGMTDELLAAVVRTGHEARFSRH